MSVIPPEGGVLPVDKPSGPTSHDMVSAARRVLDLRKVGHTGTLDPLASGLLLLCVGPATRLSQYLSGLDKAYRASARLGIRTSTHDVEGRVVSETDAWREVSRDAVEKALDTLRGTIRQRPPVFSAKKVAGEAAHRRVRRGEAVALEPVEVVVHELEIVDFRPPVVELRVRCSSGTYVRGLARDLGDALDLGAHLTELRRTAIGSFDLAGAVPGDELTREGVREALIPPVDALTHLPRVEVEPEEARRLSHGQWISKTIPHETDEPLAVTCEGRLVAVAARREGVLQPRKVFA